MTDKPTDKEIAERLAASIPSRFLEPMHKRLMAYLVKKEAEAEARKKNLS